MDPVTALSGSGPAYVFLLVEAMAAAGAKLGLAPEMAMQLARATVDGQRRAAAPIERNLRRSCGLTLPAPAARRPRR